MPIDPRNRLKIALLQADFRGKVYEWLNDCRAEELEPLIAEGHRSYERQAKLYAQGRTAPGSVVTKARPGYSYHNFGLAVDAYPVGIDGDPDFGFDPGSPAWQRVVTLAEKRGLKWGGRWKFFKDWPHFEAAGPPLALCRLRWRRGWTA